MYIKSIVVDGFKSYAKRTEINGFDPAFNAITGLNGSGKSNILDAICFLLGISNLSQVRAQNLTDLIYKSGQAGVLKATVSIVFDNRQKAESPVGYETFDELTITRQITVAGKNKYLINGITAQATRVHDLFRSVQLNVNNPHFLIMQGRITKVLNMKPQEILSLLEEAAATKLYETKRASTLATIEKKESKLKDIQKILNDEIQPKLAKLRKERSSYMEYQNVIRELDYQNKFILAWTYTDLKVKVDNAGGHLNLLKEKQSKEQITIEKCIENRRKSEEDIKQMSQTREDMVAKYEELDSKYHKLKTEELLLNNAVKRTMESLKELRATLGNHEKEKQSGITSGNQIRKKIAKIQSNYDGLEKKMNEDKIALEKAKKRLDEVKFGLFTDETGTVTASLSELLSIAARAESQLDTEITHLKKKIKYNENSVRDLESKIRGLKKDDSAVQLESNHKQMKVKINQLSDYLSTLEYAPEKYGLVSDDLMKTKRDIRSKEVDRNNIYYANRWLKFDYTKPNNNFDDRKIHGVVASLIQIQDTSFNTALQTAGGGKLFNIIVEDDEAAAQLIDGNCMKERKTLLPLNKMQAESVPDRVFRAAQEVVGRDNVWSISSLIKFNSRFTQAINYVFGHCLIARDLDSAKAIAFDKRIRCKAVTLEGDVFDPEGTLVGGDNRSNDILGAAQQLNAINNILNDLYNTQRELEAQLKKLESTENQWQLKNRELDDLNTKCRQLEIKMTENTHLKVELDLAETNEELKKLREEFDFKLPLYEDAKKKTAEARANEQNAVSIKEKAKLEAENSVTMCKENFEKSENDYNAIEVEYEALTMELKSIDDDSTLIDQSIAETNAEILKKDVDLAKENESLADHRNGMKSVEKEVNEQSKAVATIDKEISGKREEIKKLVDKRDQAESNLEDVNHKIEMHHADSAAADERLAKIVRKNPWITEESVNFGQRGSMYDFEANSLRSAEQKVEKLTKQKQTLSRTVDMRGMNTLGQMEDRYKEVTDKYATVLKDKQKLEDVIADLDKRKDEVLRKAHEQVDQDFDKIFSTLLPGSRARLLPPQNGTLKDGLEFRISFGNVWKESLAELSGGQRSLVALSLILALLRFKPAPLYILDEVDAALDISHTQNIGTIIKEQFSNSQFVIVSLKDGMFNNANVLFKTKFVDGVSAVTRHVNQTRQPMRERNH